MKLKDHIFHFILFAASWQVQAKINDNWNDRYLNRNLHSISENDAFPKRETNNTEANYPDKVKIRAGEKSKQKLPRMPQVDVGSKTAIGLLNVASWFPPFTGPTCMVAIK